MKIKARDLAYYDVEKGTWVIEKIEYVVHVGFSSMDEGLLRTNFKIQ